MNSRITKLHETSGVNSGLALKFWHLSDFANSPRVRDVASLTKSCVDAIQYALVDQKSPLRIASAALNVLDACLRFTAIEPDSFLSRDWCQPFWSAFNHMIILALSNVPKRSLVTAQLGTKIVIATIDGCEIAWIVSESSDARSAAVNQVYVRSQQVAAAQAALRKILWERFHDASIVLNRVAVKDAHGTSTVNTFVEDHDEPPLRSGRAQKLAEYLGRAIAGGVTRSVLLWGNPGTGKSCLARAVVDILGLRYMRFRVEDLVRFSNPAIAEAIELFAPSAVIIDDLDRLQGRYEHFFEMLALLKRRVKLVFGTINDRKKLPAPLRRPGRFDERREIQVIDYDVVRAVLGSSYQDHFDLVKDWPIAYIHEYVTRLRFEAPEELVETIKELQDCMRELEIHDTSDVQRDDCDHDDDDDDDDGEGSYGCNDSDDLSDKKEAVECNVELPTLQTAFRV